MKKGQVKSSSFWVNVHFGPSCWEWMGSLTASGYGHCRWNGRTAIASRVAFEIFNGPVSDGTDVCHHCDNPRCVRHDHLFTGSRSDNMKDMISKRRDRWSRAPAMTHCKNGHEFNSENCGYRTTVSAHGKRGRYCRQCKKNRRRRKGVRDVL